MIQQAAKNVSGLLGRESWLVRRLRPAYESALDVLTMRRGIEWKVNGETYRVDPRRRHRFGPNYDAPVARFIRERIKPGAVCVDVGANVGVYVMQFARWAGPEARVVAFEPNPGAMAALRRHVRMNRLDGQVELVASAVGARAGSATMYASDADGMSRLGAPNSRIASRVRELTVPVVTLDEFCESRGLAPDWLFMDIEGFELAALEGARRTLAGGRGRLRVVVEMHPDVWGTAGTTRAGAESLLAELGLRAVPLTGQRDPLGEHGIVFLESTDRSEAHAG